MAARAGGSQELNTSLYLEPPQLDTEGMLTLAQALFDLAPSPPPPDLLPPLRRLRQAFDELQNVARPSSKFGHSVARQPADVTLDTAWTALYERLRAYATLPDAVYPRVRRAHELLRLIFPEGLGFLKLPYEQEFGESSSRIRLIDKLHLIEDLNALAGPDFVAEVRRAHELYGKAIGLSGRSDNSSHLAPDGGGLRQLRWTLSRSITHYALKVLTLADDDPGEVRRLLLPIAVHQQTLQKRSNPDASGAITSSGLSRPSSDTAKQLTVSGENWAAVVRSSDSGSLRPMTDSGAFRINTDSGTFRPIKKP